MLDTATVARALSRTLGGEWIYMAGSHMFANAADSQSVGPDTKSVDDPRESTDVCLEMLAALDQKPGCMVIFDSGVWQGTIDGKNFTIKHTSGPPFRDAVIELCAGEE